MPENIIPEAENNAPVESTVEAPTTKATEEAVSTTAEPKEQETSNVQGSEDVKSSRVEKRIKKLLDERKALKSELEQVRAGSNPDPNKLPWEIDKPEPLITQSDLENGIDPTVLEQRFDARMNRKLAEVLTQKEQLDKYRAQVSDHESDLRAVVSKYPELDEDSAKYDADLAADFLERYQDANYLPNGGFVPRKKASEIAERLFKFTERATAKRTAEITAKTVKQTEESALVPHASEDDGKDYELGRLQEEATETGSTEKWAEVLKRRLKK